MIGETIVAYLPLHLVLILIFKIEQRPPKLFISAFEYPIQEGDKHTAYCEALYGIVPIHAADILGLLEDLHDGQFPV